MFSRTTDGGLTWSTPVPMRKSNAYFQGNQIAVLPDGTLLNVAAVLFRGYGIQPNTNGVFMTVLRSNDAGRTWSGPTKVAPLGTIGTYNPDDGFPLRVGRLLARYRRRHGLRRRLHRVVRRAGRHGQPCCAVALDRRRPPLERAGAGQRSGGGVLNHAVEVTQTGSVAVLYYDIRNNTPAPGLPTDVWLTHSEDGGRTFAGDDHLFGPFDFTLAPESAGRGPFVGDYMGLENTTGDDLVAFYAVAFTESDARRHLAGSDEVAHPARAAASARPGPCRRCAIATRPSVA